MKKSLYFYVDYIFKVFMAKSYEKHQRRRLISSYFSVVLSITLVLFLLGLLGLLVLNTKKVADFFKEQVALTIYLKDNANEVEVNQLKQSLALAEYTKEANYVSKEDAAEEHSKVIGEDFMEFLGYNPLQNSIDVFLLADYVSPEKLEEITAEIAEKSFVEEVTYDKPLIDLLHENVSKITFWVLVISSVFLIISILLINSSIRLSVYSKRFVIKTMQMVGATKRFIRKPFIWKNIQLGFIGSLLAAIALGFVLYYLDKGFPELMILDQHILLAGLFVSIFVIGIFISWISTYFATQRFLNLKTDDLFY